MSLPRYGIYCTTSQGWCVLNFDWGDEQWGEYVSSKYTRRGPRCICERDIKHYEARFPNDRYRIAMHAKDCSNTNYNVGLCCSPVDK